jgi:hypothetical protein
MILCKAASSLNSAYYNAGISRILHAIRHLKEPWRDAW